LYPTPPAAGPEIQPPPNFLTLHRKFLEFRFVVTRMARFVPPAWRKANQAKPASRTLAVFHRADVSQEWVRGLHSKFPPEADARHPNEWSVLEENLIEKLRIDIDVTLIAITVCHVWSRAVPAPMPVGMHSITDSGPKSGRGEDKSVASSRA
jgi:hypothetical protein